MQMGRKEWYAFKKEMAPRYVKFHEALAAGDGHAIRSLMTEPGYNVRMPDSQRCAQLIGMDRVTSVGIEEMLLW